MSAPSIPNLLSLRGTRGGARGGSRGSRSQPPGSLRSASSAASQEVTVQGTDSDAAVSRLSAVDLGYLQDPYARYFVQTVDGPPARRLPIINRGTYTRTTALDSLIDSFLSGEDDKQIISLGAGTDTRPFRLFTRPSRPTVTYHEIDFPVISQKKLRIVRASPPLANILANSSIIEGTTSWTSQPSGGGHFYCHGVDLRQLSSSKSTTTLPGLRTDIPTLLLSECCLCYLSPAEANGVLDYFTAQINDLATVIYEPIRPDDPFGKQMVSNLAARGIRMPTLDVYRNGEYQEDRLTQAGFDRNSHLTVENIWDAWVQQEEKERVDSLEGLDEVEEWKLLAAHYVVVWGARGTRIKSWGDLGSGL